MERLTRDRITCPSYSGAGLQRVGMAPASLDPPHLAWALPLPGAGGHEHTQRDRNFMHGEPCSAFLGNQDWEVGLMVPFMEMHKAPCSYELARQDP